MHYFIDHNQLPTQDIADSYGAVGINASNTFNVTSKFLLVQPAKAFACQDGLMIVQQSTVDNLLVNIIIKPTKGLSIPFNNVKYYVYRGILKDSFIDGTAIKAETLAPENSFLKRVWADIASFKTNTNQPNLPNPSPKIFGFDDAIANMVNVAQLYDNSQADTRAIYVKEGEWIGNFGITQIGFEIILETKHFNVADFNNQLDLYYLRKANHSIDVTGLAGFDKRAKQELILTYIDPCAFFGMHYHTGVAISVFNATSKTLVTKKTTELYTLLLEKFATKNRVYLDIRSEKGYSYNFYQNYIALNNNNIRIGNSTTATVEHNYNLNGWPIYYIDEALTTPNNQNDVKINLCINDNIKPILFFENKDLLGVDNNTCFINENSLLNGTATDWSKDISLHFPNTGTEPSKNNVAYCIKLYYFRQAYNPSSPNTVLKNENYFDNVFAPIDLPQMANINYTFSNVTNPNLNYLKAMSFT